jgi:hypothetical protein
VPNVDDSTVIGRDILLRVAYKFLGFSPWKLALGFLVVGLGSLSVFYASLAVFGSPLMRLRGLYSYYSATIGDGLLLPIGVVASAAALQNMRDLLKSSVNSQDVELKRRALALFNRLDGRALGWIPGGLALVATVSVHVAWLLNPRTEPNWTIVSGRLNFFGFWHAAFFFFALWWFLAFLARLVLFALSLRRELGSRSLPRTSLRMWGDVNVLLAALAGFASLLYVDNYGIQFSWQMLLSSVTTLADILITTVVFLGLNLYFVWAVYIPSRRKSSEKELSDIALLARHSWTAFAFGCLLAGVLLLLVAAVSTSIAWPMAALMAGVVFPILFTENYAADLFGNHKLVPDSVECLGICLILVITSAGFLTATTLALQDIEIKTIARMVSSWGTSLGVSLLTTLICIAVAWIASSTMLRGHVAGEKPRPKKWYITDHKPMYNVIQNFIQYWGLFQFVVIPAALFIYHVKAAPMTALSIDGTITLMVGVSTFVLVVVGFPLTNNIAHLRDLEKRKSAYSSYHFISAHILFITIYVGAVTLFILGWLWISFLDATLRGK